MRAWPAKVRGAEHRRRPRGPPPFPRRSPLNPAQHDWRQQAACLDQPTDTFFPIGTTGPALEQIEAAKAICRRCRVTEHCLRYALKTNQSIGVWGGLDEDERRALRRRRGERH